ncbi:MAG: hypothetical protein WA421_11280 [Nitrososphaeraceae archaeon]
MNLDRSISNLSKGIERLDSFDRSGNDQNHWRGKEIIPLNNWIQLKGTPYAPSQIKYMISQGERLRVCSKMGIMMPRSNSRTGWEELNWKRLDKICTVILVKTALTREFVTGKVYEDQAEQNIVLTNK